MPKYNLAKRDYEKIKKLVDTINDDSITLEVLREYSEEDIIKVRFRADLGKHLDTSYDTHILNIGNDYIVIGKRNTLEDKTYLYVSYELIYEVYISKNHLFYDIDEYVCGGLKNKINHYLSNGLLNENIPLVKCKCGKFKEFKEHYYVYNPITNDLKLLCNSCFKRLAQPDKLKRFLSITKKLTQIKELLKNANKVCSYETLTYMMAVIRILNYKVPFNDIFFRFRKPTWLFAKDEYTKLKRLIDNQVSFYRDALLAQKIKLWYLEESLRFSDNEDIIHKCSLLREDNLSIKDLPYIAEIIYEYFSKFYTYQNNTLIKRYEDDFFIPYSFANITYSQDWYLDLVHIFYSDTKDVILCNLAFINEVYDETLEYYEYRFSGYNDDSNINYLFIIRSNSYIPIQSRDFYRTFDVLTNIDYIEIINENGINAIYLKKYEILDNFN